ncbi:MAG TPA: hypothetical protein VGL91_24115 [Acidobacteriota bacterium]|jgi:hypothetical protein
MIENAETGYRRGAELLSWLKERESAGNLKSFDLEVRPSPELKIVCFFDSIEKQGKPTSIMGCRWKSRFSRKQIERAAAGMPAEKDQASLESFVKGQFMRSAKWSHPNKLPAGFGFWSLQYKLKDGNYGSFADSTETVIVGLGEIGTKYEWVVFEADVYDFFSDFPKLRLGRHTLPPFPKMGSYVLVHEDYFSSIFPSTQGAVAQCDFGYAFLPLGVYKSFLGFGPGRFDAAVKQFRFSLMENGDVEIQMRFVVSPRSQKVLYLAGLDPVYGLVNLADALTFRRLKIKQRAHDKLDSLFLIQHARVYQALIDGMHKYWEDQDWLAAAKQEGQSSVP